MPFWLVILMALAVIVLCIFFINLRRLTRITKIYRSYLDWVHFESYDFLQLSAEAVSLFSAAGLNDPAIRITNPIGRGYLREDSVRLFSNLSNRDSRIISLAGDYFQMAIGVFKRRLRNSLNPLCWIEFVLFFTKTYCIILWRRF